MPARKLHLNIYCDIINVEFFIFSIHSWNEVTALSSSSDTQQLYNSVFFNKFFFPCTLTKWKDLGVSYILPKVGLVKK